MNNLLSSIGVPVPWYFILQFCNILKFAQGALNLCK